MMCGIGGIYLPDGVAMTPALKDALAQTWVALEDRGRHASGFSWTWLDGDRTNAWKAALPASEAVECRVFDRAGLMVRSMLLHTRFTTQGSTKNNGNNHPIVREGITLTHNGVLRNDDMVFSHFGIQRLHEVDTEALNAALRHGGVEWMMENLIGSMSMAWVDDTVSTQEVNLITNGRNPLVIGRTSEGVIVWASGLHHLDPFDVVESFHALPYKHYTLNPSGIISSEWRSDRREQPEVITPHSRHAAWGSVAPRNAPACPTPTPKPSKGRKGRSTARRGQSRTNGQPRIERGWIYDEERRGWRKANALDFYRFFEPDE